MKKLFFSITFSFCTLYSLEILSKNDYVFKYGLYLKLDEKLAPQISAIKAKNWLQSGAAYKDYIAVNVFRFSAIE